MTSEFDRLLLPDALVSNLRAGKHPTSDPQLALLASMLKFVANPLPQLYDLPSIARENQLWASPRVRHYIGAPHTVYFPGDIDPRLASIIGEAALDSPIALDYRTSPPRIVYLGNVEGRSFWIELSSSYEQLMSTLACAGEAR